jgi:hypothetical protein
VKVAGVWSYIDRTFTTTAPIAQFITPVNGATNVSVPSLIEWTPVDNVQTYYLYVGSSLGANNLVNTGQLLATSYLASDLPAGQLLYARLWTKVGGIWRYKDITFTAASGAVVVKATVTLPATGATNVSPVGSIVWTAVPNAQMYYVYVGSTPGAKDVIDSEEICDGCTINTTATSWSMALAGRAPAQGLATMAGQTVYLRMWTKFGDLWRYVDSSFTMAP